LAGGTAVGAETDGAAETGPTPTPTVVAAVAMTSAQRASFLPSARIVVLPSGALAVRSPVRSRGRSIPRHISSQTTRNSPISVDRRLVGEDTGHLLVRRRGTRQGRAHAH